MTKSCLLVALTFIVFSFTCGATNANTIIFDNFGLGDSYINYGNWIGIRQEYPDEHYFVANQFTAIATGDLEELSLAIFKGDSNEDVVISLATDTFGSIGSSIWSYSIPTSDLGGYESVLYITNIGGPTLVLGESYWVIADVPTASENPGTHSWYSNDIGARGSVALSVNGDWTYYDDVLTRAMRVAIIPIPAAVWLFGSGLLGLIGIAKKNN